MSAYKLLVLAVLVILIILPNLLSFEEPMCLSIDWISGWLSILWDEFSVILLNNGFLLFSSIVILPAFVLPVSPLLAFAGIWGETNGTLEAAIFSSIALSLNCVWTYWLARLCGLKVVNKFYFFWKKRKFNDIKNNDTSFWELSLILRLTPGIPFIFTNYILGALKMPIIPYLLVSIPVLSVTSFGYTIATAGIISGNFKYLGGGVALLLSIYLISKIFLKKKTNADRTFPR